MLQLVFTNTGEIDYIHSVNIQIYGLKEIKIYELFEKNLKVKLNFNKFLKKFLILVIFNQF